MTGEPPVVGRDFVFLKHKGFSTPRERLRYAGEESLCFRNTRRFERFADCSRR